ncbi:MAG: hypothetical protein CM15mP81_08620 [Alphaproteobacteria bacterium]|nr:MAG: hypothetical protein CM15mP81_08620 [Alphaproteobacteria bacterium]
MISFRLGKVSFGVFGRTLQVEYPDALGACIDLDPAPDETLSSLDMLVKEICSSSLETEVAFRKGVRRVARLVKPGASEDLQNPLSLNQMLLI